MLHFSVRKLSIKDFKSSHTDVSIVSLNLMSFELDEFLWDDK